MKLRPDWSCNEPAQYQLKKQQLINHENFVKQLISWPTSYTISIKITSKGQLHELFGELTLRVKSYVCFFLQVRRRQAYDLTQLTERLVQSALKQLAQHKQVIQNCSVCRWFNMLMFYNVKGATLGTSDFFPMPFTRREFRT